MGFRETIEKLKQLPGWLWEQEFCKIENLEADSEGSLRYANQPSDPGEANLITARVALTPEERAKRASGDPWAGVTGYHADPMRLLLDIDMPVYARESSPGKWHIAIDKVITRDQHDEIIAVLARAGIVQNGWAESAQGSDLGGCLRPPWVTKEQQTQAKYNAMGIPVELQPPPPPAPEAPF